MPNVAKVLKDEIARVARKEIRLATSGDRKKFNRYRREISELKRQLANQGRRIAELEKLRDRSSSAAGAEKQRGVQVRFSPKWLHSHREKLGLSASDYARLVGVSAQSVYLWEQGKTRPRRSQLESLAEVRSLSKREAWHKLDAMAS